MEYGPIPETYYGGKIMLPKDFVDNILQLKQIQCTLSWGINSRFLLGV